MLKALKQDTATYPRARLAELYAERMPEIAVGGYPAALYPLTIPAAEYTELLDSMAALLALHRRAVRELGGSPEARLRALRAEPAEFPRMFLDEEYEHRHSADLARGDVIITTDGPKFIELNVGAGFGGMVQFEVHRRIWSQVASETRRRTLLGTDPYASLSRLIRRSAVELGTAPSAVFINSGEDSGRPRAQIEAQVALLAGHGIEAMNVDFRSELEGRNFADNPLAIFQYSEREALDEGWSLSALRDMTARGLRGIPSQTARLLDSKKILALLSEGQPWMSAEDVSLVQRVVPWTRIVRDTGVDWRGKRWALQDLLLARQEVFVLKGSAGYSAKEVTFGHECDGDAWKRLVHSAMETEYFVAQEVVDSVQLPVDIMYDDAGSTYELLGKLVVNPFCVDGVATGCRARIDSPEKRVISLKAGASTACLLGEPA
jgi:hypothetical protein